MHPRGVRLIALLILASCGGGWKPVVWSDSPPDAHASAIAVELPDGTNGTALVMKVLAEAKAREASAISGFELQIGPCVREIAVVPRRVETAPDPAVDRIAARIREKKLVCTQAIDQELTHAPADHGSKPGFGDASVVARESCTLEDVAVFAVRYRFEIDHAFTPPDWDSIERWGRVRLAMGAPRCGRPPRNELRARFHRVTGPAVQPPPAEPSRAPAILDLVARAKAEKHGVDAARLARQALAEMTDRDPFLGSADPDALANAIAVAHALAIEADVDAFLARTPPRRLEIDAWGKEVAADIDRVAQHYERMRDVVRLDALGPALKSGAARLAAMHEHLALLLEAVDQTAAAEVERSKALDLRRTASR